MILERARGPMSKRQAAAKAGISEGWWRQVVTGVQKLAGGVEVPVNPRRETLIAMAGAVGADVTLVLEAAGMDAPEPEEDVTGSAGHVSAPGPRLDVAGLSDDEISDYILELAQEQRRRRPASEASSPA